ncbi:hypothetical protein GCM10010503_45010 [Streptomyces lucensis JCM 4490]|uniref:Secreted protein n=1 Tax=Streptomyces lucensis JCM 4490 TaxID=1306176 RepID=A0A918J8W3_9ACTN|nr:hypothetical protein GCM10010503_45010 [Streptomyces lucensis JCM 4490]
MRKRMLRSVLVAAFSAVAAFGMLAGLSGAQGDGHTSSGARATGTVAVGVETPVSMDDSVWD